MYCTVLSVLYVCMYLDGRPFLPMTNAEFMRVIMTSSGSSMYSTECTVQSRDSTKGG